MSVSASIFPKVFYEIETRKLARGIFRYNPIPTGFKSSQYFSPCLPAALGGISPLIVYHVTTASSNRVKGQNKNKSQTCETEG